ncbi:MAG: transporter substrate-binding domain-containing protein [Trichlorobacter sp.]|nr:transporter substrate-binding domain-containing protein [Trichlorobacter sp.]
MKLLQAYWAVALLGLLLLCGYPSPALADKYITAVVLHNFQPISYQDQASGKAAGFAVDITDQIAASAALKVRYMLVNNWQEAEEALKNGDADICPILVVNDERRKDFLFTDYTETSGVTINYRTRSGKISSLDELKGRTAGTLKSSQGVPILQQHPEITTIYYNSLQEAVLELISGRIDALIGPDNAIMRITREAGIEDQLTTVEPPLAEIKRAIAVNKSNPQLLATLAPHTKNFVTSPDYKQLYTRWYGSPPPFWNTKRVIITIVAITGLSLLTLIVWRYHLMQKTVAERTNYVNRLHEQAVELEQEIAERQKAQEQLQLINTTLEERINNAVSELRKKDELLINQSRMAAMGELLTSIAHQWRQPLNNVAVCIQSVQFLHQEKELTEDEMAAQINLIMDNLKFMSRTIDDFRNFFRQDQIRQEFVVHTIINRCINLVRSAFDASNITVTLDGNQEVRAIGFPNEYAQVFMNILYNARDAILTSKTAAPLITVTVESTDQGSVVTVKDNGGGIAQENLAQIFDPYFSTKGPATGTGIGLYMARTMLERMDGKIAVRNVENGAEFKIEL